MGRPHFQHCWRIMCLKSFQSCRSSCLMSTDVLGIVEEFHRNLFYEDTAGQMKYSPPECSVDIFNHFSVWRQHWRCCGCCRDPANVRHSTACLGNKRREGVGGGSRSGGCQEFSPTILWRQVSGARSEKMRAKNASLGRARSADSGWRPHLSKWITKIITDTLSSWLLLTKR